MNRRDFLKSFPVIAVASSVLASESTREIDSNNIYKYYINCYIQNQRYWPLEEYKKGCFAGKNAHIYPATYGEKWIDGKLRFASFSQAVEFVEMHSLVTPFYNEISYEIFHETSKDPMIAPKHIFNYWVKLKEGAFPETIKWIHPDYIDHTSDGALIEYVK